jgi:hypothetical protein
VRGNLARCQDGGMAESVIRSYFAAQFGLT